LDPRLGVGLIGFAVEPVHKRVGPIQAAVWGVTITGRYIQGIVGAVSGLAGNPRELFNQLAGPVGAGKILGDAARIGIWAYIDTAAVLSVTIGIFNLLPIPALDGGRIVFLLVEAARRRPINPRVEAYVNTAGFALLVLLLVTLTWRDIIRQLMGGM
jgi:regulator of sigma E protease